MEKNHFLMNFKILNINIIFHEHLMKTFHKYLQDDVFKYEAGGIMTGLIFENMIEVCNCSIPSILDKRSRFNFLRSKTSAQQFLKNRFKESKGREIYLGEWHTHPEKYPTPSNCDIVSFKKSLKKNKLYSNIFIMLILGTDGLYVAFYNKKGTLIYNSSKIFANL